VPKLSRVLFTESSPNLGGQELQLLEQARGLAARGVQTRLLCPEASRIAQVASQYGVPVLPVPFRNSLHPRSVLGVRAILADWRPDALLCHSGHDADASAMAARLLGGPRPRLVRMRTYQHGAPHAWTYNRLFDRTLVPSEEMRRRLLSNPRVRAERIAVLRPGIAFDDLDVHAALPLDPALEQTLSRFPGRRLTHAAMLRGEKGHLFMLDVVARLRTRFPDLCYVIAGEGVLKEGIHNKAKMLGLQANVCFAGLVRELAPLYVRSELVVMPSSYEPLGMSQIEALGLGVPVVASRVGGIPETVHDRRTGLLASPGDVEAWTEVLSWALEHGPEMRAMAAAGRADVRERFALSKVLDELAGHLA
jgi:glycosyltransferase involved in cell wall biosynthesis